MKQSRKTLKFIATGGMDDAPGEIGLFFNGHYAEPPVMVPVPSVGDALYTLVYDPANRTWTTDCGASAGDDKYTDLVNDDQKVDDDLADPDKLQQDWEGDAVEDRNQARREVEILRGAIADKKIPLAASGDDKDLVDPEALRSFGGVMGRSEVAEMTVDMARPGLFLGNRHRLVNDTDHQWTVFVASSSNGKTAPTHVKSVTFKLHPSCTPQEVTITQAPFALRQTTSGEAFEVGVQIEFSDGTQSMNKKHKLNFNKKLKSKCIQAPTSRYFAPGNQVITWNLDKSGPVGS